MAGTSTWPSDWKWAVGILIRIVRASHVEFWVSAVLSIELPGRSLPTIDLIRIFQLRKVNHMWNGTAWIDRSVGEGGCLT